MEAGILGLRHEYNSVEETAGHALHEVASRSRYSTLCNLAYYTATTTTRISTPAVVLSKNKSEGISAPADLQNAVQIQAQKQMLQTGDWPRKVGRRNRSKKNGTTKHAKSSNASSDKTSSCLWGGSSRCGGRAGSGSGIRGASGDSCNLDAVGSGCLHYVAAVAGGCGGDDRAGGGTGRAACPSRPIASGGPLARCPTYIAC